jgi:uroporphyrinogen III methyltransferase/synthase
MTDNATIKVISRNSPLALLQVKELFALFPSLKYEVEEVSSYGDRHKHVSLMSAIAEDFFTRELDEAVRSGRADIAVHSAKDLPYPLPAGQELYCLTAAADKSDSLVSRGNMTLAELPAGSRIGTSSKMRREELLQLRSDVEVVSIRGTIEERIAHVDNGDIDALIVATCALQRLGLSARIAERLPFATHPLQGNLAVTGLKGRPELKELFAAADIRRGFGRVTLVGFGPGNPDLLTIGGDKALREADIIFHDDLIDSDFLGRYSAEKVYVGKRSGKHSHAQDEINELLYSAAIAGRRVVRLKGGDPMVFAHGREEIDYLQRRFVDVNVVPGVSAGIALAALTQIPLTHRGVASSVAFVSGHGKTIQTPDADTLVYYMGGDNLARIAESLIAAGRDEQTPAAIIYNVSRPDQREILTTLKELRYSFLKGLTPVALLVGHVVDFEVRTHRQQVLFTGTMESKPTLACDAPTHTPLIKLESAKAALPQLVQFDWIVFTSRYGVRYFFEALQASGQTATALRVASVASVGPVTTAALAEYGIHPVYESPTESAKGIVDYFARKFRERSLRILLPRSDKKLNALSDGLSALGHDVTDLTVYRNTPNDEAALVNPNEYTKIIFSSPTGVEAFINRYTTLPDGILYVAKGRTTAEKVKEELL